MFTASIVFIIVGSALCVYLAARQDQELVGGSNCPIGNFTITQQQIDTFTQTIFTRYDLGTYTCNSIPSSCCEGTATKNFFITYGPPGSGKGTIALKAGNFLEANPKCTVPVDVDAIVQRLPRYAIYRKQCTSALERQMLYKHARERETIC